MRRKAKPRYKYVVARLTPEEYQLLIIVKVIGGYGSIERTLIAGIRHLYHTLICENKRPKEFSGFCY